MKIKIYEFPGSLRLLHLLGLQKQMKPGFVLNIGLKSGAGVFLVQ